MRQPADTELLLKSRHLAIFRLAFALVSLSVGSCIFWFTQTAIAPAGFFGIAAAVVAYSLGALVLLNGGATRSDQGLLALNSALLGLDILCLSALVHFTGGVESDLYFLYLFPILLSSYTFSRRGIFATACGASLAYAGTLVIESWGFLPYLSGLTGVHGLAAAYAQRLWVRIVSHASILVGVAFIWAAFCQYMSQLSGDRALRLKGQLDANQQLVIETQAHAAREHLINSISAAIRSTLDLDKILATCVHELSCACASSRCAIVTAGTSPESPLLWENPLTPEGDAFSQRLCEFLLDKLSRFDPDNPARRSYAFLEPCRDAFFAPVADDLQALKLRSLVAQPIVYGSESKGVLILGECRSPRRWSESELELIQAVGGQVAIAIEHARLVEQLSRKNRDLLEKNLHLDAKNLELRSMQSHLIHQEKMASLGRIVAGIAHELNNPINFVHGNLPYLKEYFAHLEEIIGALGELPAGERRSIDELKEKLRYDFMVTDLENILADLTDGTERIRQIIRNLRSFSRLDEAELKEASIQEGIESTLKILSQYYGRDKIPVETRFADLPDVCCYPGKLNQVWMNLLSNAAEALSSTTSPCVTITTELDGQWVIVSIHDNGPGIKPQDQSKIFEPFYTTRPVGQGTGLGLSISHAIVERHGGQIWFETESEQGTTFKVKIPLAQEEPAINILPEHRS